MTTLDDLQDARAEFYERAAITVSADYLRDYGIDRDALEARAGCLGILRGEMLPGSRWYFRPDGDALAVIEVFGPDDESTLDLCAWPADGDPARFATMFGNASVLGAARVENPATYHGGQPLRVFRTPLGWLQAGCEGVVILDRVAAVDTLAEAPGRIAGEDIEHGREIARLLRHYVDPRKVVAPIREAA